MPVADPHRLILTGENPFIRLSEKDGDPNSTDASYWRILFCPAGPGHVLYVKSEMTHGHWRIYSDNIAMARWLQQTVLPKKAPWIGQATPGEPGELQRVRTREQRGKPFGKLP